MRLIDRGGALVAETATVVGRVSLAPRSSVWYGAVLRADMASITVGEYSNLQDNCVVHTDPGNDLVIGRHVTVGHMAMLHCRSIGDRCLIGIHSILLDGAVIGEGSLIAAGALVREGQVIPPRSIVVGLPGTVIGQVTDAQWEQAVARARRYWAVACMHRDGKADPAQLAAYVEREMKD
jgi:carbonic anhydrase/acetyltransferase-like protein (isoleucine patch superfamily)